ncbi:MAG: glycosyltransferase [Mesorhizobium sp.]|nr:MAG: glycosyltransferase [Mesorhizobium sp.]
MLKTYPVLNCITSLSLGGAELMLARFARSLKDTAYKPQVLSLMKPGPVAALLRDDRVSVNSLGMGRSKISLVEIARLRSIVRGTGCDILHGWMYHGNIAASVGAFLGRKQPVIWSIHHSVADVTEEKPLTRLVIRMLARISDSPWKISYCSRVAADQHESLGFDPSKRVVIPNGIDCGEFQPRADARQLLCSSFGIPADRLIVGNVARAHPMKNHEGFVRTIALLLKQGFNIHGLIIGAGHDDGSARRVARDLGIDDRLTTPGPQLDIPKLLPGLDAFALSSAWGEAFPLSVAEAMACGVPTVATDVGDCGWLLGDNDLISKPRDPGAQAAILRRILTLTSGERRILGLAGRNRVLEHFSLDKYTHSHVQLYQAAMEGELRRRWRNGSSG